MHVGFGPLFQNLGQPMPDHEVYARELDMALRAEEMGFDSVWSVEHHFTDYSMMPDVVQFLSYMAGHTRHVQLGSMVVVLPWHDPLRVAEQVAMLDVMSGGRMILGVGRGLGRVEFDGFRVPMGESRERFIESAQMVLTGLERGYCEFEGNFVNQPRRDIRPAPFKTFKGRTFAAAVSPDSMPVMAKLGVGLLVIPQNPGIRYGRTSPFTTRCGRTPTGPAAHRRRRCAAVSFSWTRAPTGPRRWHTPTSATTTIP